MIESMPEWIINVGTWLIETAEWWTTGIFGVVVYWLPLIILFVYYSMKAIADIQEDRVAVKEFNSELEKWKSAADAWKDNKNNEDNEAYGGYKPSYSRKHTTIGVIVGHYFIACVPVVNLFLALFDALGEMMTSMVERIKKIFNINIVGKPSE